MTVKESGRMKSFFSRNWVKFTLIAVAFIAVIVFVAIYYFDINNLRSRSEVEDGDIRIAAVGDSITYGLYIENLAENSYPRQLDDLLGEGHAVLNFGESNYTAQASGDYPYVSTESYQESLDFEPDIAIIMMGTNDSKAQNWNGREQFKEEYVDLVESYQELPSISRILLASPPRAFVDNVYSVMNPDNVEEIGEVVEEVAREKDLEFVDMYEESYNSEDLFPDGIHPNAEGAGEMARIFYDQITGVQ